MLAKKKKIRKNKYKTPEKNQKKRRKVSFPFAAVFSVFGAFICLASFSALLVLSYSWLTQTSALEAEKIEITGVKRLSEADILKQAGIKYGMNIFEINLSVVQQKLLAHPWIKKAELFRSMPDTIQIRVQEHLPLATVEFGAKYLMNREGVIFNGYSDAFNDLPVVSGLLPEDITIFNDDTLKAATTQHSAVLEILKIQHKTFGRISDKKVHTIKVDRELGLSLLSGGQIREVKLGFENYPQKLGKLEEVVKYITQNDNLIIIETIDLVNINRVVIKPANETNTHNFSNKEFGGYHAST